jgi:Na+/proline symporter
MRRRPVLLAVGLRLGVTGTLLAVSFIGLIGFFGVYGLTAAQGMGGLNASIFPKVISPFTLRAFGALHFALAKTPFVPCEWWVIVLSSPSGEHG